MENYKTAGIVLIIAFFLSCATTIPETKYMPRESDDVFPFFTKGQPIAAVQSDNAFILLSMERTILANRRYFRLWILYQNISEEPYLLEPLKFTTFTLTSVSENKTGTSNPESPTKILADISNEKALSLIVQAIGGSLQSMAANPTTAETRFNDGSSATTTIYDQQEKKDTIADQTANAMANTAMWYDLYQNSISDGILRRNTIFPGQSVNGFIYFPFPIGRKWRNDSYTVYTSQKSYFLRLDLDLPGVSHSIYFEPIKGE